MDRITLFYMSETCVVDDAQECCEVFDACVLTCLFPSFLTQAQKLSHFVLKHHCILSGRRRISHVGGERAGCSFH